MARYMYFRECVVKVYIFQKGTEHKGVETLKPGTSPARDFVFQSKLISKRRIVPALGHSEKSREGKANFAMYEKNYLPSQAQR